MSEWLGKRCQIASWAGEKTQATKGKGEDMLAFSTGGILNFKKKPIVCIRFGCTGSSLLRWLSLVVVSEGCSLLWWVGFSLWCLLLLQSMRSRASGLQELQFIGSRA